MTYWRMYRQPWINSRTAFLDQFRFARPRESVPRTRREPVSAHPRPERQPTFEEVTDPEYLIAVFHDLSQYAGSGPGSDGVRYDDLGKREIAECMRGLSRWVRQGDWYPGPERVVAIPKTSGGFRQLRLRSIYTRVIAAALTRYLTPILTPIFLPGSYSREGMGHLRMLAAIKAHVEREQTWVIAQDDVRNAYDNVAPNAVMPHFRRHFHDEQILGLIERVLRGGINPSHDSRDVGIDQGSALSGLALGLLLHYHHDMPVDRLANLVWFRYCDNIVYLCHAMSEGRQAMTRLRRHLRSAGLELKRDAPVANLSAGATADLLGFRLSHENGKLRIDAGQEAWNSLQIGLRDAHRQPQPSQAANLIIHGWLAAQAPTLEYVRERQLLRGVRRMAAQSGFGEIPAVAQLHDMCSGAIAAWTRLCMEASHDSLEGGG